MHLAFNEHLGYQIDNFTGATVSVEAFTESYDAQGRDTSSFASGIDENVTYRKMNKEDMRLIEGEWNSEDVVILAKTTTIITLHSRITIGSDKYIAQRMDTPNLGGETIFKLIYCKKQN